MEVLQMAKSGEIVVCEICGKEAAKAAGSPDNYCCGQPMTKKQQ